MAWENKGLQKVYYRSKRVNGRVIKTYLGTGRTAQLAYDQDLRQQKAREQERATRKEIEALDRQTNSVRDMTKALVKAHLLLAGYHQHHRCQWRKQRKHNVAQSEGDTIMVPQIQGHE